jgi:hypothetical protein
MKKRSVIFKVLGVIVGLVFMVAGLEERSSISRIKSFGTTATVNPIDRYTQRKRIYTANFSFKTSTGQAVSAGKSFPKELIDDFKTGRPVKVFYNPNNPNEFVFEKETTPWTMTLGGVGIAVAALIFI